MADIGRERQHVAVEVALLAVPLLEASADEGVPQIVQSRGGVAAASRADAATQALKGVLHGMGTGRAAVVEDEERGTAGGAESASRRAA